MSSGKRDRAEPLLRQVRDLRAEVLGKDHPDTLDTMDALGAYWDSFNEHERAEAILRECLAVRERIPENWMLFNTQSLLGGCLARQKRYQEAEALLVSAYEKLRVHELEIPASLKSRVRESLQRIIDLYTARGSRVPERFQIPRALPARPGDSGHPGHCRLAKGALDVLLVDGQSGNPSHSFIVRRRFSHDSFTWLLGDIIPAALVKSTTHSGIGCEIGRAPRRCLLACRTCVGVSCNALAQPHRFHAGTIHRNARMVRCLLPQQ
jgi:hypothetical protein